MSDHIEFRRLLARLLDGELTDSEFAQLSEILRTDEAARDIYMQQTIVSAQLERLHCAFDGEQETQQQSLRNAVARFARTSLSKGLAAIGRYPVMSCAAALVVLVSMISLLSVLQITSSSQADLAASGKTGIVAQLVATSEAKWAPGQVAIHRGAHLLAGHVVKLVSGRAEILFDRGARVVLKGPAHFVIQSENAASLLSGDLAAQVPKSAHGFLVKTPSTEVVDLGTQFAVAVDELGDSDVHVFQGSVELAPAGSDALLVIRQGESRQVVYSMGVYTVRHTASSPQRIVGLQKLVEPLPEPAAIKLSPLADAYVEQGQKNRSFATGPLLLVKHNPRDTKFERETWITFDVSQLDLENVLGARLLLTLDWYAGNHPHAAHDVKACRFGLYGVTDDAFSMDSLSWETSRNTSRRMLGMFRIDGRGERGNQIKIGGAQLMRLLKSNHTGKLTLAIVRHDEMDTTVHAFASSEHPELAAPVLEVWQEAKANDSAKPQPTGASPTNERGTN